MIKLNIHLSVDDQTEQYCRRVNEAIRSITDSTIIFSDSSPMIPHITLVMGDLVPSQTLEGLTRVTETLAQGVKPIILKLGQPYIETLKGRYVFCDIKENHMLTELRKQFSEKLMNSFLLTLDTYSETPHLTLANIDARQDEVRDYLKSVVVIPQTVCNRIEISHVGPKGTCIDRLFAFELTDLE